MTVKQAVAAVLPMVFVVVLRLAGPMNVDETDQCKQALYLVDVMENGNWVLPMERGVEPATKPPVLTWIAAALCAPLGKPSYFVARLPSAIAAVLMAWMLFRLAAERWNVSVGIAAAWMLAACHPITVLCTHFRTDMLLAASVTGTLFALHRLEQGFSPRWAWIFWSTLSFGIFVKGPPAVIVVAGAVGALLLSPAWRKILVPVLCTRGWLLLLIPLGWFVLAYGVGGNPYVKFTVLKETFDRFSGSGAREAAPKLPPGYLLVHFLSKCAPFSILALIGMWFAVSKKTDPAERRKLLLMAAWLGVPMILFNLSKGQRTDYQLPLLPAACAMAAALLLDPSRPIAGRLWRFSLGICAAAAAALSFSALTGTTFGAHTLRQLADDGGVAWGIGLLATALLFLGGLLLQRRPAEAAGNLTLPLALGILGFVLVHGLYSTTVAPGARTGRGEAMAEFGERVRRERRTNDELHIFGSATNGMHYYLDLNQPALTRRLVPLYLERTDRPGRLLLAASGKSAGILSEDFPGRFETVFRLPQGLKTSDEFVLLALKPSP